MTALLPGEEPRPARGPDATELPADLIVAGFKLHALPEGTRYPVRDEHTWQRWVYITTNGTTYYATSARGCTERYARIDEVIAGCYRQMGRG